MITDCLAIEVQTFDFVRAPKPSDADAPVPRFALMRREEGIVIAGDLERPGRDGREQDWRQFEDLGLRNVENQLHGRVGIVRRCRHPARNDDAFHAVREVRVEVLRAATKRFGQLHDRGALGYLVAIGPATD